MKLEATKTPLLIAAIATAITITTFGPASAKAYWASAPANIEAAHIIDAGFKVKVKKHKHYHHGLKHHGLKKKKYVSPKAALKKKLLLKKLF